MTSNNPSPETPHRAETEIPDQQTRLTDIARRIARLVLAKHRKGSKASRAQDAGGAGNDKVSP